MSNGVLFLVTVPSAEYEEQVAAAGQVEPPPMRLRMQKVVEDLIETKHIYTCAWSECQGGNYKQATFTLEPGDKCDDILNELSEWGIGSRHHSSVSVIPCSLHWTVDDPSSNGPNPSGAKESKEDISTWNRLVASVKARITVAEVVEGVKSDALLTFDFLVLLIIAGLIAALGLIENSTGILVASMLISPLMGPIMAGTVGTIIKDKELMKMGILNEIFGLLICLLEGFICGIVVGLVAEHFALNRWPTVEMVTRGELHSVWVGMVIALLSGAGVAISVLGDNIASLVGVAISASLLPPAVNAGLLWALTCIHSSYGSVPQVKMPHTYADHPVTELGIMGAISLCLTFVNIVCIFASAIVVLRLKAVAPSTSAAQRKFWTHDVKLAQEYDRTNYGDEAKALGRKLVNDIAKVSGGHRRTSTDLRALAGLNLFHRGADIRRQSHFSTMYNQCTWSPTALRETVQQASLQDLYGISYASPSSPKVTITVGSPDEASRCLSVIAEDSSIPPSLASSSHSLANGNKWRHSQRFMVTVVENGEDKQLKQ
ncbi:uncharacterized protein LOC124606868 [Schistocerca americana]|uniref:uncharacterized protein LOC124606868 n=1 Tax=Schistocerca americana TaxID=7009 RepID=UPI001F4F19F5|nr:uncharacterized protein LOC124606868 [Schistocerca americana]XP_049959355.1 uncharacterized protein LOC126475492 isoform X2 [Schistocerca serialis cubense]